MRIKKVTQTTPIQAEVVDSLDGNSTTNVPSVRAVNDKMKGTVLFEGDTNDTLTLSDSAANYDYMEIYFYITQGGVSYNYTKIYNPNNKNINVGSIHRDLTQQVLFFITSTFKITNTQMVFQASGKSHMYTGDQTNLDTTSKHVYITRVVGYKI